MKKLKALCAIFLVVCLVSAIISCSTNSSSTPAKTSRSTPTPTINVPKIRQLTTISAGKDFSLGVKNDGTVVATGNNDQKQCAVSGWKDIISVDAGGYHAVGLKKDGSVVATGSNKYHQCDVSKWENIVSISAGDENTVGVQKNGTVIATGNNNAKQCNVTNWVNIATVSAGFEHTVGLTKEGTAIAVGDNKYGQCNVSSWDSLVAVCAGPSYSLGLRSDGSLLLAGGNSNTLDAIKYYSSTDLVEISVGGPIIFLHKSGQVFIRGAYIYHYITKPHNLPEYTIEAIKSYDVSKWPSIIAISSGYNFVLGLTRAGTVVAQGNNDYDQCKVGYWTDIRVE